MKEPNLGTPDEDGIRAHFGKLLSPDIEIEVVPHTRVWATIAGMLLWDPKNGYAGLGVYREPDNLVRYTPIPSEKLKEEPALKQVIYLTGPMGSGKSHLVSLMADAVELTRSHFIGFMDLSRNLAKNDHHQTVVITNNSLRPDAFDVSYALSIWCRERKIKYLNINLTPIKDGN